MTHTLELGARKGLLSRRFRRLRRSHRNRRFYQESVSSMLNSAPHGATKTTTTYMSGQEAELLLSYISWKHSGSPLIGSMKSSGTIPLITPALSPTMKSLWSRAVDGQKRIRYPRKKPCKKHDFHPAIQHIIGHVFLVCIVCGLGILGKVSRVHKSDIAHKNGKCEHEKYER